MFRVRRRDRFTSIAGRRRALRALAALAGAWTPLARSKTAPSLTPESRFPGGRGRRIAELIGANGWAGAAGDVQMWRAMGISWGRGSVGPGQPDGPQDVMRIDKTSSAFDSDLPPALIANDRHGIGSLLQLGYTPGWNASVPGDSNSAPVDVEAWERYVDAVVRTYSAPPYNLRYFQIWNEAAGRLSGGLAQATFWNGPDADGNVKTSKPYEHAMQDYVERIHIPAARIIRKYHAYVVYGGWPDQGGLDNFRKWLEYRSPTLKERMLDWVDYIDTHYLQVAELDSLYQQYVRNGPARGVWQTEIGDAYMKDPHYLPRYFFDFAVWALDRNWDDPNKYLSMVYHWDGYESFRLTHRGPPRRTYNASGRSLVVLNQIANGSLASFSKPLQFDSGASGSALRSGHDVVMQVSADPGWQTVSVGGIKLQSPRNARVEFVDALTGTASARDDVALAWQDQALKIRFRVPDRVNGADNKPPKHLAYLVIRGVA
ncbi:hypothetical protein A6V36_23465 [Paraburkholderia ginsengiterrae]|uniref:Uncharacterized protein n=1 Tax=Paraburkholderia ginsengiterrae TaxID=1462993 RepID=A0A1A9NE86_9BURK|nr:hypothetical protein [Paraburkholderia ginsengiterrae]OAJ61713.1 hypothetical protein A6V36_23465 [Paraburkholderia ginsengiterrae]OAJ65312.1 hypothetical protein A6V37_15220 [Paraburkholderia ginsengiterrae]